MPINFLPYRAYNEQENGSKPRKTKKRMERSIKDTLQQHGLTIIDATRQAKARILKTSRHQINREHQHLPSPVTERRNDDLRTITKNATHCFLKSYLLLESSY
jgi:hypothetical protein